MKFNRIEMQTYHRKESYNHYLINTPCTYSMTVNLNITKLMLLIKSRQLKFFPTILYGISNIVNKHQEFRMDLDEHGELGYYEATNPCYTIFHSETETFTNVWTEYNRDFKAFINNYDLDMKEYQHNIQNSKPLKDKNIFNVSCIPWTSFTGFNLNLQKGYDYFPPIFTIGKYFSDHERIFLPLAIQVHHAVCDGFHTARFINELQEWADNFSV